MTASRRIQTPAVAGNTDTSFLKMLALALMLTDHLGVVIFPNVPELRIIGRMALPLYAWCLVVGSQKTRSMPRYCLRMLALAVVSQPLYMLALNHTWTDLNILFLLLLGLIAIWGMQSRFLLSQFWTPALCYMVLGFCKVDYGWKGLTFILLLYLARNNRGGLIAAYLAYALFWGSTSSAVVRLFGWPLPFLEWPGLGSVLSAFFRLQGMVWLSLPLIACQTHQNWRVPKWFGYAAYPLHLVLLILLRLLLGTPLSTLLAGF